MTTPDENFKGRRILLIAPQFFGYDGRIAEHLRSRGAEVEVLDERPSASAVGKSLVRLKSRLARPIARAHFDAALTRLRSRVFDDVVFCSPEASTVETILRFRAQFSRATFVLYMWDSFDNKRDGDVLELLRLFDRVLTFDDGDATAYGVTLRPLFFSQPPATGDATPQYSFSFIGTIHSDRYKVIRALCAQADALDVRYYVYPYLPSLMLFWLYRVTKREFSGTSTSDFHFEALPYADVARTFAASTAILDIEHPRQRGLTMRTIEVIGAGKKLITTNARVRKYPFFSPNRVAVIDRLHPQIPRDFIASSTLPLPASLLEYYSLHGWANSVFDIPGAVAAPSMLAADVR